MSPPPAEPAEPPPALPGECRRRDGTPRYLRTMSDLTINGLLTLERRGWDSLCASEGGTFYGGLMTPDAVMILVNGMVLDRPTIAQTLNESPP